MTGLTGNNCQLILNDTVSYNSLFVLTTIFPSGPGLANTRMSPLWILLELRMLEGW